jgi:hypothetical protein
MDKSMRQTHRVWVALFLFLAAVLALRKTQRIIRIVTHSYASSSDNDNRYTLVGSWFSNININH